MFDKIRKIKLRMMILIVWLGVSVVCGPAFAANDKETGAGANVSERHVSIDFSDVDIRVFIKFISEMTGRNFVVDKKVSGKVTVISPEKVSIDEAFQVFESVLEVHGFAAVQAGSLTKIVPAREAQKKNIVTRLKAEAGVADDHVVTQLVRLKYADPTEVKRLFTPLISKSSSILAYKPTNTLIITDLASNLSRLMKILRTIDVNGIGREITILPLEYADAKKFVTILKSVFTAKKTSKSKLRSEITFVADDRTNSIIVLASKGETEKVTSLVKMMDKEVPRGKEKIHVYYLEHATAEDLAKVLQGLAKDAGSQEKGKKGAISGEKVTIMSDKATNSLIIVAEKSDYVVLEDIIKKLDIPRTMVYIECLIMEVNVNKDFNLGAEWTAGTDTTIDGRDGGVGVGFGGASGFSNLGGLAGGTNDVSVFPAGFSLGLFSEAIKIGDVSFPSLGAVIQAFKQDEEVQILSTPQVLTTDNEEAKISVGSKIPYLTKSSSGDSEYNNYEYKDVGISLTVTPQISKDRKIRLAIAQETSRVVATSLADRPTTLNRNIDTTVVVHDGNTIVLGGLIDESFSKIVTKVPCLGDIPVIRYLFSAKENRSERTNLYVFLTPRVVAGNEEAKRLNMMKREQIDALKQGQIKLYDEARMRYEKQFRTLSENPEESEVSEPVELEEPDLDAVKEAE